MSAPIGLQMYTLRDDAQQDFLGTLTKVAELGYAGVELAGYGNLKASELARALQKLGLRVSGAHTPLNRLEDDLDAVIDEMKQLNAKYVICPWLPPDRRPDGQGYRELGRLLNDIGETCQEHGLQLVYHHHDFELQRFDGVTGLDLLLGESEPENVQAEIDVYWASYAGFDPIALLKRLGKRVPLVHLKDMTPAPERTFAEVGHGTLDMPGILAAADEIGAEWLLVEQDRTAGPALESVAKSIQYLRGLGR